MTNASLRERFDLPASEASQVSRLIKTCTSSNLLKIADPDAGKRYVRYLHIGLNEAILHTSKNNFE